MGMTGTAPLPSGSHAPSFFPLLLSDSLACPGSLSVRTVLDRRRRAKEVMPRDERAFILIKMRV